MKNFCIILAFLTSVFSIYAEPVANQTTPTAKTAVAKSYSFSEELVDLPIKPFAVEKINDSDLVNINPKALEAYEAAVKTESEKDIIKNPANAIKAWIKVTKINDKNPFLQIAKTRLEEWKNCVALFNEYTESANRVKVSMASQLLSEEQKTEILKKHLDTFGMTFGAKDVTVYLSNMTDKLKEILTARCEKNIGKDCFDKATFAQSKEEKILLLYKACELKYQAGCDEIKNSLPK